MNEITEFTRKEKNIGAEININSTILFDLVTVQSTLKSLNAIPPSFTTNKSPLSIKVTSLANDDTTIKLNSFWIILFIINGLIIFSGILANSSLIMALCSHSSGRLRNPVVLALSFADLMVTGISAPSTIVILILSRMSWTMKATGCKFIYYIQSIPVAASSLSFWMLSLDRYVTVKHPKIAKLRKRPYIHTIFAIFSWLAASIICIPIFLSYNVKIKSTRNTSSSSDWSINENCQMDFGSNELQTSFNLIFISLVFLLPGIGVILNHFGLRHKLCSLSLTARAAHGELPLPMPIFRRPTNVIIVTGLPNSIRDVKYSSNDGDAETLQMNRILKRSYQG